MNPAGLDLPEHDTFKLCDLQRLFRFLGNAFAGLLGVAAPTPNKRR